MEQNVEWKKTPTGAKHRRLKTSTWTKRQKIKYVDWKKM